MLRPVYIILFLLATLACQKSQDNLLPQADLASIAGTWQLTEVEQGNYGNKFWQSFSGTPFIMIIAKNGAILNADSLALCCAPNSLNINGQVSNIEAVMAIAPNPLCALVNCTYCPVWEIEWRGSQLILTNCDGSRQKFTKK